VGEEEEAVVALDEMQHLVGDHPVSGIAADLADEGVGEAGSHAFGDGGGVLAGLRRGVEEQQPQVRVVLRGEGVERLVEPGTGFVGDDDRYDGRCLLGLRFHDESRLQVGSVAAPSLVPRQRTRTRWRQRRTTRSRHDPG